MANPFDNAQNNSMRHARKGFTVIELLVVIGVILVLAALVTYGMGKFTASGQERETKVTLENLQAMLKELDQATNLQGVNQNAIMPPPRDLGNTNPMGDRFRSRAVLDTRLIILRMQAIPANKRALENMPPNRLMRLPDTTTIGSGATMIRLVEVPVVLDAFNNPILFIPAGGVRDVKAKQGETFAGGPVVKGARVRHNGYYYTALTARGGTPTQGADWFRGIMSPNGQPFWASAGRDGNFEEGDDNLYSIGE